MADEVLFLGILVILAIGFIIFAYTQISAKPSKKKEDIGLNKIEEASGKDSEHHDSKLMLFNISKMKLAILSVATLGIYNVYFFYKNWKALRDRAGLKVSPTWRGLLGWIFCYSLAKEIFNRAAALGDSKKRSAGGVAVGYIILSLFGRAPGAAWLISALNFIPLFSIQDAILYINKKNYPKSEPDGHFSIKEIGLVILGLIIWGLVIIGLTTP